MSELKAYTYDDMIDGDADTDIEYYPKSEVDRYISELIANQQLELDEWYCKVEHHKYKRCLAMAMWCDSEMNYWYDRIEMEQCQRFKFYNKWHNRWLELAERFK